MSIERIEKYISQLEADLNIPEKWPNKKSWSKGVKDLAILKRKLDKVYHIYSKARIEEDAVLDWIESKIF